jgi:hypothetical protein
MEEQEAHLFPFIEQAVGAPEPAGWTQDKPCAVTELMTGNQVVGAHPETQAVFKRFFINIAYEGYYRLDELAWTHGIECRELLRRLEAEVARRRAPGAFRGMGALGVAS